MKRLSIIAAALALAAAHAHAEWVPVADKLTGTTTATMWCNAQRTACATFAQAPVLFVMLQPGGLVNCEHTRPRYITLQADGAASEAYPVSFASEGQRMRSCAVTVQQQHARGAHALRFALPMYGKPDALIELPLAGLDMDALPKGPTQ